MIICVSALSELLGTGTGRARHDGVGWVPVIQINAGTSSQSSVPVALSFQEAAALRNRMTLMGGCYSLLFNEDIKPWCSALLCALDESLGSNCAEKCLLLGTDV